MIEPLYSDVHEAINLVLMMATQWHDNPDDESADRLHLAVTVFRDAAEAWRRAAKN